MNHLVLLAGDAERAKLSRRAIGGRAVFLRALDALLAALEESGDAPQDVFLLAPPAGEERFAAILRVADLARAVNVLPSCGTLLASLAALFSATEIADGDFVLFHAACRPVFAGETVRAVLTLARESGAALTGAPLGEADARESTNVGERESLVHGQASETLTRETLVRGQTPEVLTGKTLRAVCRAAEDAMRAGGERAEHLRAARTPAALAALLGFPVKVAPAPAERSPLIVDEASLALAAAQIFLREGKR